MTIHRGTRSVFVIAVIGLGCSSWQRQVYESKYAVNDCKSSDYVDLRKVENPVVDFSHHDKHRYEPPCLMVDPGQVVEFRGDFTAHPLKAGIGPAMDADNGWRGDIGLIPAVTSRGSSLKVKAGNPGSYGFYCAHHEKEGMRGAILVAAGK